MMVRMGPLLRPPLLRLLLVVLVLVLVLALVLLAQSLPPSTPLQPPTPPPHQHLAPQPLAVHWQRIMRTVRARTGMQKIFRR